MKFFRDRVSAIGKDRLWARGRSWSGSFFDRGHMSWANTVEISPLWRTDAKSPSSALHTFPRTKKHWAFRNPYTSDNFEQEIVQAPLCGNHVETEITFTMQIDANQSISCQGSGTGWHPTMTRQSRPWERSTRNAYIDWAACLSTLSIVERW